MTARRPPLVADGFAPDGVYLDTGTYGLAPAASHEAVLEAVDEWRRGTADLARYDSDVVRARTAIAEIVQTDPSRVAVANQVSVFVGQVAASLSDGTTVLAPEGEFTSVLFPFLVHADRGFELRSVPLAQLADSVTDDTDVVAFSLVQSADGRLADVDGVLDAAARHQAKTVVDATQAAGWLPIEAGRFDVLVASCYKWLLSPRGTAFMVVGPHTAGWLRPVNAGWYAGDDIWASVYGTPLRLATAARRFDVSPAWMSWAGAAPSLELVASTGVDAIHRHDIGLANDLRTRLGMAPGDSATAILDGVDPGGLADQGIVASVRVQAVRVGFHLYNSTDDVAALVAAVRTAP